MWSSASFEIQGAGILLKVHAAFRTGKPVLGGLHHEYRLEREAA
jgi:hypothetical protein